jgi:hypothetical protein
VPLVREDFSLLCSLNILFLRRDFPLGVMSHGGLDNRLKTLIDSLRKPHSANELVGNEKPGMDEDPFYCLLEDDDLVTGLAVETDMLLGPLANGSTDLSDVKLPICRTKAGARDDVQPELRIARVVGAMFRNLI